MVDHTLGRQSVQRLTDPLRMSSVSTRCWPVRLVRCDRLDVSFVPIQKVASSSLFQLFHTLDHPDDPQPVGELHRRYGKRRAYRLTDDVTGWRFLVVRDPVERLLSAYANRVVEHRVLTTRPIDERRVAESGLDLEPDLHTFVDRLDEYRRASGDVYIHTNAQSWIVRRRPEAFHRIFLLSQLDELRRELSDRAGFEVELPHEQRGGPKLSPVELGAERLARVVTRYRRDYEHFPDQLSVEALRTKWGL